VLSQFAPVLCDLLGTRVAGDLLEAASGLDRPVPFAFCGVEAEQRLQCARLLRAAVQSAQFGLGAVEQASGEEVERQFQRHLLLVLRREPALGEHRLVDADGAVGLALAPEQAGQRKLQLGVAALGTGEFDQHVGGALGVVADEKIQRAEVGAWQVARLADDLTDVDAGRSPAESEERWQRCQPPVFDLKHCCRPA